MNKTIIIINNDRLPIDLFIGIKLNRYRRLLLETSWPEIKNKRNKIIEMENISKNVLKIDPNIYIMNILLSLISKMPVSVFNRLKKILIFESKIF